MGRCHAATQKTGLVHVCGWQQCDGNFNSQLQLWGCRNACIHSRCCPCGLSNSSQRAALAETMASAAPRRRLLDVLGGAPRRPGATSRAVASPTLTYPSPLPLHVVTVGAARQPAPPAEPDAEPVTWAGCGADRDATPLGDARPRGAMQDGAAGVGTPTRRDTGAAAPQAAGVGAWRNTGLRARPRGTPPGDKPRQCFRVAVVVGPFLLLAAGSGDGRRPPADAANHPHPIGAQWGGPGHNATRCGRAAPSAALEPPSAGPWAPARRPSTTSPAPTAERPAPTRTLRPC